MVKNTIIQPELSAQRQYVEKKRNEGFGFDLVVADAFVRGMRDLGYRSTATAIDELIDNAIQASATKVAIAFGYGASNAKPTGIAVIDNGHGMDPDMTRLSVIWGATHRENDRTGFGRYGYGLPSASVSQGRRFSVYSTTAGEPFHSVTIDVDEIGRGAYGNSGTAVVPEATPTPLPNWVIEEINREFGEFNHGTVVVIDKLDRLTWVTASALTRHLTEQFGLVYRNVLRETSISVNGVTVDPIDPLFLTPGARHYDLNDVRAEAFPPLAFEVKDATSGDSLGLVKVRYSYMPPGFLKEGAKRGKTNARFAVRSDNNGVIVLRQGRQIDVITRPPFTVFQNNDRYIGVEVDFPPTLDEEFRVTTSKQQVGLSERMWQLLVQHGMHAQIKEMRARYEKDRATEMVEDEDAGQRASERVMEDVAKFKTKVPGGDPERRREEAEEALEREVDRRAEQSGVDPDIIERELLSDIEGHPYRVEEENLPGAPFYRVEQRGGQRVLLLNRAHRFYTDVYAGVQSTPYLRASLEVLLFVLGECELESNDDRRLFYQVERGEWSTRLGTALDRLNVMVGMTDIIAGSFEDAGQPSEDR